MEGAATNIVMLNWDFLQHQISMYINSDLPGFPPLPGGNKPVRALVQRLKGKSGRFRCNLSGKRVDFSSRTVISPDPNLAIEQVGVPRELACILTFPEKVTSYNIQKLKRLVKAGAQQHPGANSVSKIRSGLKFGLKFNNRNKTADDLELGDVVERHLNDGDILLFNRQPSLHRISIMSHRAKILEGRTFRFNECCCNPYNADFDGDEMNVHVPQTQEARAEALTLMSVVRNLVTPRHGVPLVCAIQDFITTAFLLSRREVFLTRDHFCQIVSYFDSCTTTIRVPPPTIIKPMKLWTGKQLMSLWLKPNKSPEHAVVNLKVKAGNYEGPPAAGYFPEQDEKEGAGDEMSDEGEVEAKSGSGSSEAAPWMCPRDGYVIIHNSELLCGNLCKKTLGGSNKGLFFNLIRNFSPERAALAMTRLAKLSSRWIGDRGFSIGIDDVMPSDELLVRKQNIIETAYGRCGEYIAAYREGTLQSLPGLSPEETVEKNVSAELSDLRTKAGSACLEEMNALTNSPMIMVVSGAKGNQLNISQMVACVGQQTVAGDRIQDGFEHRTLPHFAKFSKEPDSKGFVADSFYTGLSATQFFFHMMAGREGLVDSAVKTAETGYMQRRLMKALEDLCVYYDGTVRTAAKEVVQFRFGDDGLDPIMMADGAHPLNFEERWESITHRIISASHVSEMDVSQQTSEQVKKKRELQKISAEKRKRRRLAGPEELIDFTEGSAATAGVDVLDRQMTADEVREMLHLPTPAHAHPASQPSQVLLPDGGAETTDAITHLTYVASCHHPAAIFALLQPTWHDTSQKFLLAVREFLQSKLEKMEKTIREFEMASSGSSFVEAEAGETDNSSRNKRVKHGKAQAQKGRHEEGKMNETAIRVVTKNIHPFTRRILQTFLAQCMLKYDNARIEPGTTVGAIAAQSIGEPGTQMTLKTFHFAGVASMNITLGVPRVREVINATPKIKTPFVYAKLQRDDDETVARLVKGRIEKTLLGDVAEHIHMVIEEGQCYIEVKLSRETIQALQLDIMTETVADSILFDKYTKLDKKGAQVKQIGKDRIRVYSPDANRAQLLYSLEKLMLRLPHIPVAGVKGAGRAIILDSEGTGRYEVVVEGDSLLEIIGTEGVNGIETTCNHVLKIVEVLGIEAARSSIIKEIFNVMDAYGLDIDFRHVQLLAEIMTFTGAVLGQRHHLTRP